MRWAVAASGAWRWMRASHDSLVSSMAAHSSPRGSTPADLKASAGTGFSMLPMPSRPRALAKRRAGSTVTTSTLPPSDAAARAAAAAEVVVLPTPPDPHTMAISLAASRCSSDMACSSSLRRRGVTIVPLVAQLRAQGLGNLTGGAEAVGAHEQVGHIEQGDRRVDRVAKALDVARPGAAHGDGQPGRLHHRLQRAFRRFLP